MRWSFSKWETYFTCPAKYRFRYLDKLPEPQSKAAARGTDMHALAENYILGKHDDLSWLKNKAIIPVLNDFRHHTNGDRHMEYKLSFDVEWDQCGHKADNVACVGVLDAVRVQDGVVHIAEWKSGKPKETHADQRKLYALFGLRRWLGVEEVRATTYYFDDTSPAQRLVASAATAEDKLRALWNGRVETMQNDKIMAPKANDGCYWCAYSKKKGGPCPL